MLQSKTKVFEKAKTTALLSTRSEPYVHLLVKERVTVMMPMPFVQQLGVQKRVQWSRWRECTENNQTSDNKGRASGNVFSPLLFFLALVSMAVFMGQAVGNYEIQRAQRDEVIQNLKREGFDRQKRELAKRKHELEMRKIDVALESKRLEVGGQRLALERRKLELKERSKKNELEDLIEIEENNLLRDKMLVERKYFGRHVVIDTEWQKLEHASQGRVWKFERECWIEIEERRQELDKMQVELENRAEANNRLIQEIESQYYGGRPFEPSLIFQELRAPAIEFFQRVNNYSHEAENFQTTSQQTTKAMEIGDGENEKDDVKDSSADDDGEETKELDIKTESETHQVLEKKRLVESKTESETQQKNEEEEAKPSFLLSFSSSLAYTYLRGKDLTKMGVQVIVCSGAGPSRGPFVSLSHPLFTFDLRASCSLLCVQRSPSDPLQHEYVFKS
ncbi:hypothetical protein C0Q70_11374 [Pomacea canaliculata]|uniref:Uncharacterized protein n=1 Tax=Pomacea canaliculata TaxID=400727 RepID=A0A2T7P5S7_POMCA|nr:hypothetical protein C0Q70_11374 [Pomacea canaliculata]